MITKKRLILVGAVATCLLLLIILATNKPKTPSKTQDTTEATNSVSDEQRTVTISGIDGLNLSNDFSIKDGTATGQMVYGFLIKQIQNPKPYYSGNVREGSFTRSSTGDVITGSFIVDIPEAARSFKVLLESTVNGTYNSIYVVCPAQNELIYKPVACSEAN